MEQDREGHSRDGADQSHVLDLDDGAVFTIDRPSKLNSVTNRVLSDLEACLDCLEGRGASLLVIRGSGERAFCAGTDLAELQALSHEQQVAKCNRARDLMIRLSRSPLVSVAAVNGLAFGAGMELAMSCTLRLAAPSAVFALPEIKLGLLPAYAGTQMLPAIVGPSRALEIMLTGREVPAEEAQAIGLVHRILDDGAELDAAALAFGRSVTRHGAAASRAIRDCVAAFGEGGMSAGLQAEAEAVRAVFDTPEARARLAAFLDKKGAG